MVRMTGESGERLAVTSFTTPSWQPCKPSCRYCNPCELPLESSYLSAYSGCAQIVTELYLARSRAAEVPDGHDVFEHPPTQIADKDHVV